MNGRTNPITQFKQHKTAKTGGVNTAKATTAINPPPTATTAKNGNQSVLTKGKPKPSKAPLTLSRYPQVDYLFQQAKWSGANCKVNHPNCFHLKQLQRYELREICKKLQKSDRLLQRLAQATGLNEEDKALMKAHQQVMSYLLKQFNGVADYIDQVEQAEGEALNALCYRKE